MKSIALILVTILFFSCADKNIVTYSLPSDNDINEIISEIILTDSIPVLKNHILSDTIKDETNKDNITHRIKFPFCINLEKFRVCFPEPISDSLELTPPPPPGLFGIYFKTLLERGELNNRFLFSKSDSAYFVFQDDTLNHFTINGDILNKIYTTTKYKQQNKEDTYFACTIPIFSADKSKAYVELNYRCFGLCSYGKSYLLSKVKNHWTIVKKEIIWFS